MSNTKYRPGLRAHCVDVVVSFFPLTEVQERPEVGIDPTCVGNEFNLRRDHLGYLDTVIPYFLVDDLMEAGTLANLDLKRVLTLGLISRQKKGKWASLKRTY